MELQPSQIMHAIKEVLARKINIPEPVWPCLRKNSSMCCDQMTVWRKMDYICGPVRAGLVKVGVDTRLWRCSDSLASTRPFRRLTSGETRSHTMIQHKLM
jgi:hypothetical protein